MFSFAKSENNWITDLAPIIMKLKDSQDLLTLYLILLAPFKLYCILRTFVESHWEKLLKMIT